MLVASLTDLRPIDYREAFKQTSFSANGPNDQFLEDMGYVKVNTFKQHNTDIEKLVSCEPYLEDGWVYTVRVETKTEEELSIEREILGNKIRIQRNNLLSQSDWTQLNDTPLSDSKKQEWSLYRQALRDITLQEEFPHNIVWPISPTD